MSTPIEVGVAHFAAICGMSENQFMESFMDSMEKDSVDKVLTEEASEDVQNWAKNMECVGKNTFCLAFKLSINRKIDSVLYCLCSLTKNKIKLVKYVPGLAGMVPDDFADKEMFEINFCDINMSLPQPEVTGIISLLREAGKNVSQNK